MFAQCVSLLCFNDPFESRLARHNFRGIVEGGVCAESLQLDKSNRFAKTENLIRLKVISVGHTNQVGEKAEGIKKSVN